MFWRVWMSFFFFFFVERCTFFSSLIFVFKEKKYVFTILRGCSNIKKEVLHSNKTIFNYVENVLEKLTFFPLPFTKSSSKPGPNLSWLQGLPK